MSSRYENISAGLSNLAVTISASEAYGMLAGLLCTLPSGLSKKHWFTELLDLADASPDSVATHARELKELDDWFTETVQFMNDPDMSFPLFLPNDNTRFIERQHALADFCAGYNYGFGIGMAGKRNQKLPADTRELLDDFQAIEGADPASGDQADENAFVELVEYVRMGVLYIHAELQPGATNATESSTANKVH